MPTISTGCRSSTIWRDGRSRRWCLATVTSAVDTLRGQSAFLDDLWTQVAAGKKAGKTLEQLLKDVNLSRHGNFAADEAQNQAAIRSVFRKAPER